MAGMVLLAEKATAARHRPTGAARLALFGFPSPVLCLVILVVTRGREVQRGRLDTLSPARWSPCASSSTVNAKVAKLFGASPA
jgi:hypothetical protein